MKKFIAIYLAPAEVMAQNANMSKEDYAKGMAAWMSWKARCGDHVVDFGAPLMPGVSRELSSAWSASTTTNTGYSILQGENIEEIQALFEGHPHLSWGEGCSVELHEFAAM